MRDEKTGIEFSAEIGQEQIVNEFGDKLLAVNNLKINGETFNVGDIINVEPDPDSLFGGALGEQYKIERINVAKNDRIAIVGRTVRGGSDVFYADSWKRITKQKFSR